MRIITGEARGTRLVAPEGLETRPTSEMTKEAVFSMIQFEVENAVFLDLFAGSGQMGLEALSRGAKKAYFVDQSRQAQDCIRQNILKANMKGRSHVVAMDAISFLRSCRDRFDLVFLDPPYHAELMQQVLAEAAKKMTPNGIILCETLRSEDMPEEVGEFVCKKPHRYGKTKITVYRRKEGDEE